MTTKDAVERVRFCRDCALYSTTSPGKCRAPQNATLDLVTGEPSEMAHSAADARAWSHLCGRNANWFEPKSERIASDDLTDANHPEAVIA